MDCISLESLDHGALNILRRHNLLAHLVRSEVIKAAVETIPLSGEQESALLESYCEKRNLTLGDQLSSHLSGIGLSQQDLIWQICLENRIKIYCEQNFMHKAEARFLERKENLDTVVYSLLRVQDPMMARELYMRIAGNEADFNALAGEFSQGPERNTKGVIGPVPLTQAHPILAERLRTTEAGKLMEPFQIEDWWLVARLERHAQARFDTETAIRMAREMFENWVSDQTAAIIPKLKHKWNQAELHDGYT